MYASMAATTWRMPIIRCTRSRKALSWSRKARSCPTDLSSDAAKTIAMAIANTPGSSRQGALLKPALTVGQIFTMSCGFMGIQSGFALQNANTSRILRSFGADVDQLPLFWIVAPVVGMIVQPLIGHYSDRTWNRLGRRKPYFLTGALLSSLALILLPNSGGLAGVRSAFWIVACWVRVLDASFNVTMALFMPLVAANLPDLKHPLG